MTKFFSAPPASSMNFSLMPVPFRLPPPTISSVPFGGPYSGATVGVWERPSTTRRPGGAAAAMTRMATAAGNFTRMLPPANRRLPARRRGNHALQPEIGHQIAVVLVVVPNLTDQRADARHDLRTAERPVHH